MMTKAFVKKRVGAPPSIAKIRFPKFRRLLDQPPQYREWAPPRRAPKIPFYRLRLIPGSGQPEVRGGGRLSRSDLPWFLRRRPPRISMFDEVELKRDIGKWPAGTRGIAINPREISVVLKISDEEERPLALLEVPPKELQLVARHRW